MSKFDTLEYNRETKRIVLDLMKRLDPIEKMLTDLMPLETTIEAPVLEED